MLLFPHFLPRVFLAILVFMAISLGFSRPASAALVFCNRTQASLDAALGYRDSGEWISEGWWRIEPGQCARVFGRPLSERFYFYYATALVRTTKDKAPFTWAGKYRFCTDAKAFRVEGDDDCESKGYRSQGFREIDIGVNAHDYTLDFKDNN